MLAGAGVTPAALFGSEFRAQARPTKISVDIGVGNSYNSEGAVMVLYMLCQNSLFLRTALKGDTNMKTIYALGSSLVLTLLCVGTTLAVFDDIGVGARPLGMGGAFVAVADDVNAAMHNPAGLGFMTAPAAGFTHVRMIAGVVDYSFAGIVLPVGGAGSLGASFGMLGEESDIYSERSIALSYSKQVVTGLSLGANIKMLNTNFDEDSPSVGDNPYFDDTSTSNVTFDLGVLAKPVAGLSVGLSGENLIPADISVSKDEEEKVPANLKFGLAYRLSAVAASAQQPALREVLETAIVSLESAVRKEREVNVMKVRAGMEAWFSNGTVGLRAGYRMKKVIEMSSSVAVGASVRIPISELKLQLDYALQLFGGDIEEELIHRVSVAVLL